jgi:hypothetical protein
MGKLDKDYDAIKAKVERAAVLIAQGIKESRAAKEVGLPRSSLQRYLAQGIPGGQVSMNTAQCPDDDRECKGNLAATQEQSAHSCHRDLSGRYLPGSSGYSAEDRPARLARNKLEKFCPNVADKLIRIFKSLPNDRPDLILAYAREILDRGIGKPVQSLNVKETHTYEEYAYFEAAIMSADADTIRAAVGIAQRLEGIARDIGGASFSRQMAILPPPGGSLFEPRAGGGGSVPANDNNDAAAARKE